MSTPIYPDIDCPASETMLAAVYTRYGAPEVLRVQRLRKPSPQPNEIRVRVEAATVTSACTMMRRGDTLMARVVLGPFGPRPRFQVAGIEFAGTVDEVGGRVHRFRPGDRVFGFAGFRVGTYAQYFCIEASASVAPMPQRVDFGEAASLVDGPTTALFFLQELAKLDRSERVLVIGAAGSVGGAAVQVARSMGAHVTGVCSTANVEFVRSLGAHEVVDYTHENFAKGQKRYDVIFDAVTKSSYSECRAALAPGGRYLPTVASLWDYVLMGVTRLFAAKKVICGMSVHKQLGLQVVTEMLDKGELHPTVSRRYPLADIAEAHRYVDTGHKRGNVVIEMHEPGNAPKASVI